MSRDFEFKQLLRAYRSGILSEATFEREMARLEEGKGRTANGAGFHAFGRVYESERAAIISFLDRIQVSEANGGEAFALWGSVCKNARMRTGIRMIAEREAYHARIFEQRLLELGGEKHASPTEEARKFREYLGDPNVPDKEKLERFTKSVGDPDKAVRPIRQFTALITEDAETREALRLFAEDELSSAVWLWECCAALNAQAAKPPSDEGKTTPS